MLANDRLKIMKDRTIRSGLRRTYKLGSALGTRRDAAGVIFARVRAASRSGAERREGGEREKRVPRGQGARYR
jgi:hypothetical protein